MPSRPRREGWPSGLWRRPAKALVATPRGFESHSLRFGKRVRAFGLSWRSNPHVRTHVHFRRKGTQWVRLERRKSGSRSANTSERSCAFAAHGSAGRVAEWLKAHDWKSCGLTPAWVRIPPRPFCERVRVDGHMCICIPHVRTHVHFRRKGTHWVRLERRKRESRSTRPLTRERSEDRPKDDRSSIPPRPFCERVRVDGHMCICIPHVRTHVHFRRKGTHWVRLERRKRESRSTRPLTRERSEDRPKDDRSSIPPRPHQHPL